MERIKTIIFLIWMFVAIFVFAISFHNVDLSYNFKGFEDCNSFNCVPIDERYVSGVNGMFISFGMVISAMLYLVYRNLL
jgi:hypothetical protein